MFMEIRFTVRLVIDKTAGKAHNSLVSKQRRKGHIMQNITTTNNGNNVNTYAMTDYTVEYAVTLMAFNNSYMVYGAVHHEDYSMYVENDVLFTSAQNAFEALKNNAFVKLSDYDAYKMCELLSELAHMWDAC